MGRAVRHIHLRYRRLPWWMRMARKTKGHLLRWDSNSNIG
jgi:hypothetical protein